MKDINMPDEAARILSMLNAAGYPAYIVGGCVRDSLLGKPPKDWDICTSATPDQVRDVFRGEKIIALGEKYGTLSIIGGDGVGYEVTTFRTDGVYNDNRHPGNVRFVSSLRDDLSRRDFTVNAIAYSPTDGFVDYFGGAKDLTSHIIRCVGDPDARFTEDALRIMRAMRFASVYGFQIDPQTTRAIHEHRKLLHNVSAERIRDELVKLLMGNGALQVLLDFSMVIGEIIPELESCIGFEQNNRYHCYTVYDHIAHAVDNYKGNDPDIKVALLLHDIGKPLCYTEDERGGHFYGHAKPSRDLAEDVLTRFRFDNVSKLEILALIANHDAVIEPTPKTVRRWLNKLGPELFAKLLDIRMADILAHEPTTQQSRIDRCNALRKLMGEELAARNCFSLKDLAINGDALIMLGMKPGKELGAMLNYLLDGVMDEQWSNDKTTLMRVAKTKLQDDN